MALHRIGTDMDRGKARDKVPPGQPGELWDLLPAANQQAIDSDEIPQTPLAGDVAYLIVHDQAMLDGNAALNLATFVSTWMDDYAKRLYAESYDKNMIDKDERQPRSRSTARR